MQPPPPSTSTAAAAAGEGGSGGARPRRTTISPRKRYSRQSRAQLGAPHSHRPCLDFEKMQQVVAKGSRETFNFVRVRALLSDVRSDVSMTLGTHTHSPIPFS